MASKTCMYYLQGNCRFGRKCRNSHDVETHRLSRNAELAADRREAEVEAYHSQSYAGAISTNQQPDGRQLLSEASKAPRIKQPNETVKSMKMKATKLSAAIKEENNTSIKVNGKESPPELHQKNQKESPETCDAEFNDVIRCAIDRDLQCNICYEIFIKPTVLNCSHTFCETCIFLWTKESMKCPICREFIRSKSLCLTLNSFIEKVVEHYPLEIKQKREEEIIDRSKIDTAETLSQTFNNREFAAYLNWDDLVEVTPLQHSIMDPSEFDLDEEYDFSLNSLNSEYHFGMNDTVTSHPFIDDTVE